MTDFRKWFVALAVLVLVAGLANAQVLQCNARANSTRVRAEGLTELVGDIILDCSGIVPSDVLANIQIFLGKNVTSKITHESAGLKMTEALLTLDEPLPAAQVLCSSTTCNVTDNVRQGAVIGDNSLMWFNVPVLIPPATTRTIRITNVRVAVKEDSALLPAYPLEISALITVQSNVPLPINNSTVKVAAILKGMSFGVYKCNATDTTSLSFSQCSSQGKTDPTKTDHKLQALLKYSEGTDAAFRIKVRPGIWPVGQDQAPLGAVTNASESGYINTLLAGYGSVIGWATNGTRLIARFQNIPQGISIFVTTRPTLAGTSTSIGTDGAKLISVTDTTGTGGSVDFPVDRTGKQDGTCSTSGNDNGIAPVTLFGGAGAATWEIAQADNGVIESVAFGIEIAYDAKPDQNIPSLTDGTPGQVAGLLAPVSTVDKASSSAPIPRFWDFPQTKTLVDIKSCASVLLFPFVTAGNGFDTGIAITNTTLDNSKDLPGGTDKKPYKTTPQNGACTLYYFGKNFDGTSLTAPVQISSVIKGGEQLIFPMSQGGMGIAATPMFTGYIFAVCNFELAHGFAYISDLGAQKLAMGYLALVMDLGVGENRSGRIEKLDN